MTANMDTVSPEEQALIARWDRFLAKMQTRIDQSLLQAEEATLSQLEDTDYDYYGAYRAWQGIRPHIDTLNEKVEETWSNQVEPQMRSLGDAWMDESFKLATFNDNYHTKLVDFQVQLEGKLSEKFYAHAVTSINQNFTCTQCSAPLEVKKDVFNSQYVDCQYCNTVNTFTPDTKFMQIGWNVLDNICTYRAFDEYTTMQNALRAYEQADCSARVSEGEKAKLRAKYRDAARAFFERFYNIRAELVPSGADDIEQDVADAMKKLEE